MRQAMIIIISILTLLTIITCNSIEPPPNGDKSTLALKLEDVSCTEAWITLTTTNLQLPATITLKRDNTVTQDFILSTADTLLYIDSLLPNVNYSFQVSSIQHQVSSNVLSVTTLDTTSHNFTWQTFTFGEHSSSTLYDVAIIDENNIWAVGEIYMNDSLGNPDPNAYNAAHWDGQNWELKKILYKGGIWTIRTICAFNENDVWFSAFVRYDGQNFIELPIPQILTGWSINKIWGTSSNDLYIVGNNGNIAWYNGSQWTRIESGTTTNINDIWGIKNIFNNESLILCTVSSRFQLGDYKLLSLSAGIAQDTINWNFQRLYGVWFNSSRNIYVVGDDIHMYKNDNWVTIDITDYFLTRVKGTELNNIFISGCCDKLFHFNGITWEGIEGIIGNYEGLDVKEDLVISVGWTNAQAIIVLGVKTN